MRGVTTGPVVVVGEEKSISVAALGIDCRSLKSTLTRIRMIRTHHRVPSLTIGPTNANDHESKARVHPASPLIVAVIDDGTLRLNIAIANDMGSSKAVRKGPVRTLFYETLRWYKTRQ